jgi:hypothetical protein
MLERELSALRETLVGESDFARTIGAFFDLTERGPLIVLSRPARFPILEQTVGRVAVEALGLDPYREQWGSLFLLRYRELIHGGIQLAGRLGTFFYFEDLETGLLSIQGGAATQLARFQLRSGVRPELN